MADFNARHCDYKAATLHGNWNEQRYAPDQPQAKYNEERFKREPDLAITCLTSSGIPMPLPRRNRVYKWDSKDLIPDDGFREMYTINKTEIQHPERVIRRNPSPNSTCGPKMINKRNLSLLTSIERPVPGHQTGWSAVLQREPKPEHDLKTTTQTFYGTSAPKSAGAAIAGNAAAAGTKQGKFFGELNANAAHPNRLTGEFYRNQSDPMRDPQNSTKIQRTWIVGDDPAMKMRAYAPLNDDLPDKDNFNSLPLGQGEYFRNPIQQTVGAHRRLRSDATTAPRDYLMMNFR